ncbi:TIM barrel protein [Bacillus sp. JJ1566]|uniref:sugar phosphate isomerase/epimerase family protein n=1 Tax=Bacillus sp. JJ1566 TaxID=3122961 RepID=UPI002FFEFE8F
MKITLGISTGFTIKRWTNPTYWVPLIKEELGLDLIQFSFDQLDPRSTKAAVDEYCNCVVNQCNKYGLEIHSTFTGLSIYSHNLLYHPLENGRRDGIDWFEKSFEITKILGCHATGGPIGGMDIHTFKYEEDYTHIKKCGEEALVYLLRKAKQNGIIDFYWEATPVEREGAITIEDTRRFIGKINNLVGEEGAKFSLCFDMGHTTNPSLTSQEKDPYLWIEKLSDTIPIIHLQQTDGKLDRHWPFTEKNNKKGTVDASKLVKTLEHIDKKEIVLLLELGHPFEENDDLVLKEIKESVEYWKNSLKEYIS